MEQIIINAIKNYGLEKALGMFAQEDVDDALESMTGGGIGSSFINRFTGGQGLTGLLKNPGKRFLGSQAMNALTGGGSGIAGAIPLGLLGGAMLLGRAYDPMRPGSKNYNPYLQDQVNYLSGIDGMIGRDSGTGLAKYGPGSVLAGQNVSSLFGTNDYIGQLEKNLARLQGYKNPNLDKIHKTNIELQNARDAELKQELAREEKERNRKTYSAPYTGGQVHGNGGNNNGGGGGNIGGANEGNPGANKSNQGHSPHFARGGIANVNLNRGQLGEQLYG